MAITITPLDTSPSKKMGGRGSVRGDQTEVFAEVQFDGDYQNPAGMPYDVEDFDPRATELVHLDSAWSEDGASLNRLHWDRTNDVLRVFVGSTNAEAADEAVLSGDTGKFIVRAVVKIPNG